MSCSSMRRRTYAWAQGCVSAEMCQRRETVHGACVMGDVTQSRDTSLHVYNPCWPHYGRDHLAVVSVGDSRL